DSNGDGVQDLVLGAPNLGAKAVSSFVFLGPVTTGDLSPSDADATFMNDPAGEWTGGSNAAGGDVDGDGVDDLLISSQKADDGAIDNGVDWFFYGPVSGSYDVTDADVR